MASQQTQPTIGMPWVSAIPVEISLFMKDLKAYAGGYNMNTLHFCHNHLSKLLPLINTI